MMIVMIYNTYQPVVLFGAVVGFAVGMMFLILGRFGKRIDHHPICKHCRFDLIGSIEQSEKCPECGRDIRNPRAVLDGHRRPNRILILISIILLIGSIGGFALEIVPMSRSMDWIRIKPTSWLIADIHGNQPVQQSASANELARRIRTGSIGDDTTRELVTPALGKQADRSIPWSVGWGNILDEAIAKELLTAEERRVYLEHAVSLVLDARYEADEDEKTFLVIGFSTGSLRIGSGARYSLSAVVTNVVVDGKELQVADTATSGEVVGQEAQMSIFGLNSAGLVLEKRKIHLGAGEHPVVVTVRLGLVPIGDPKDEPIAETTIDMVGAVTVSSNEGK